MGEGKCPLFVTVFGAEEERDEQAAAAAAAAAVSFSLVNFSRPSAQLQDCLCVICLNSVKFSLIDEMTNTMASFTPGCPLSVHPHPHTDRPKRGI